MAEAHPLIPPLGIGLIGAGAFGEFCLAAFAEMPEVRIAAVADVDFGRAQRIAAQYNAAAYHDLTPLLADPEIEIVALNTPPALHGGQGLAALAAGKHLFCEKPLALSVAEGEQMIQIANQHKRQLTVDYVMRQNPYWAAAAALARAGVLGALRHIDLANHANGLSLPATHWFWDESKSGGMWIEHGVHFFDAFQWVAGQPGEVHSSAAYRRPDGAIDRVEALLGYGQTAAHCYHAFDQSGQTEQTTVTLTFERGYVTLREGVPTGLELKTAVGRSEWQALLPSPVEYTDLPNEQTYARAYAPQGKSALYRQSIQAGMRQLVQAVRGQAALNVTGQDGLDSLRTAVQATEQRTLYPLTAANSP